MVVTYDGGYDGGYMVIVMWMVVVIVDRGNGDSGGNYDGYGGGDDCDVYGGQDGDNDCGGGDSFGGGDDGGCDDDRNDDNGMGNGGGDSDIATVFVHASHQLVTYQRDCN